MRELTYQEYETIKTAPAAVVEFASPTCAHCKQTEAVLNELAADAEPEVTFGKVDITKEPALAEELEILSVPTVLFIRDGQITEKLIGAQHRLILAENIRKLRQ